MKKSDLHKTIYYNFIYWKFTKYRRTRFASIQYLRKSKLIPSITMIFSSLRQRWEGAKSIEKYRRV